MGEDPTEVRAQAATSASSSTTIAVGDVSNHPDAPIEILEEADSSPPTPRFIQDERSWKRWKWVPYPIRRFSKAAARWARGPSNPRRWKIDPLLPQVQRLPITLLNKVLPQRKHRIWLAMFWLAMWVVTFALVMRDGLLASEVDGWGTPIKIGCGAKYWSTDNGCGLDGNDCRPFTGSGFAFKCPASCSSYMVLNPHAVGDQEVLYKPIIVGGPPENSNGSDAVYRGDSYVCGSAIHAGLVSDTKGGCGVVKLVGTQRNFHSSTRNGLSSFAFDSYFPLSFTFERVECDARDSKWSLLAISVVFSTMISLFTTSSSLFFFSIFTGVYWTVGLATDVPTYTSIPALISKEVGNFLPALLAGWVMYDKMGVRRTLHGLTAQVEKSLLWLGACWVGALTNHTFDFIPIQRLTPHDLAQQPGARAALAIIVVVITAVVVSQIWFFRQEARLLRFLALYILYGAILVILILLPSLSLRIHHYILALLLLPGTSMQTRPSLLYQGLLMGFFLNGIARWGWAPVLETAFALQGDAQLGSPLPRLAAPVIELGRNLSTIAFSWAAPPAPEYDGLSVLVNDVERYRTYFADGPDASPGTFTWTRKDGALEKEYFRFAWMQGSDSMDYTKAGTWSAGGEWIEMAPGPSRVKRGLVVDEDVMAFMRR